MDDERVIHGPDWTMRKTFSSQDAFQLLLARFPELAHWVAADDLDPELSFMVYSRFIEEIDKLNRDTYFRRAAALLDELATSEDRCLSDLLCDVFETLSGLPNARGQLRTLLGPEARRIQDVVEADYPPSE